MHEFRRIIQGARLGALQMTISNVQLWQNIAMEPAVRTAQFCEYILLCQSLTAIFGLKLDISLITELENKTK